MIIELQNLLLLLVYTGGLHVLSNVYAQSGKPQAAVALKVICFFCLVGLVSCFFFAVTGGLVIV